MGHSPGISPRLAERHATVAELLQADLVLVGPSLRGSAPHTRVNFDMIRSLLIVGQKYIVLQSELRRIKDVPLADHLHLSAPGFNFTIPLKLAANWPENSYMTQSRAGITDISRTYLGEQNCHPLEL